jgi:hypothetical protein
MDRKSFGHRLGILSPVLVAAALLLALAPSALAKTYKPNKTGDSVPNGCSRSDCTLREAVIAANASTSSDKIILEAGKTYKLSRANAPGPSEEAAATGDLDINGGSLTIQSSEKQRLAKIKAQGIERVFDVGPVTPASASLRVLKISGGNTSSLPAATDEGGGVLVQAGSASLKLSSVSGNVSNDDGGGVAAIGSASVAIKKTTLKGNYAVDLGGGLMIEDTTHGELRESTVNGNSSADLGGGIDVSVGSLNAINSTITENSSANSGGGIRIGDNGTATLQSITVARNHANTDNLGAANGGGLSNGNGPSAIVAVQNSIAALNTIGAPGTSADCGGSAFTSAGVNLFTNLTGCTGFGPPNLLTSNPKLGKLKNNGGPTKTIELKKGSSAINHAGSGSPKRDQRGEKRKKPDIGAFERT